MDYKAQVISNAEEKYQAMLSGTTPPLIRPEVKIADSGAYEKQRGETVKRLAAESIAFDRAIDAIRKARKDRENASDHYDKQLSLDKSQFAGITWTTVIHVILMALFAYACIALNLQEWAKGIAIPLSFDYFLGFLNGSSTMAPDWVDTVTTILIVVGTIGMIIIFHTGDLIEGCGTFVFFDLILAPLCGALVALVVRALIGLLSHVLHFLLLPYGALLFGLAAAILILIIGADLLTAPYKQRKWFCTLGCVAVSVVVALIGFAA